MTAAPCFEVTLPDGEVKTFISCSAFDGYVKWWRQCGFVIQWHGPRVARILRPLA